MAKQYFYFVSYVGKTDKRECSGNYRVYWDKKINTPEEFNKFNAFIRDVGSEASEGIPVSSITIMNIQLLT